MPRVMHVISGLSVGGTERVLTNLLHGGLATRFESCVVSLSSGGAFESSIRSMGVRVEHLSLRHSIASLPTLGKFRRVVRAFAPDMIQGWMYHGNLFASLARSFARDEPAVAWNIRQCLPDLDFEKRSTKFVIALNRRHSGNPRALIFNSALSMKQHADFGFSVARGMLIPNGFDLRVWTHSSAARQRIRAERGIPGDAIVFGHIARWHPVKDHATFLRAAVEVARYDENVHFLLSGAGIVEENEALNDLIPLQQRRRFHFLGERQDVPDLMSSIDAFCLSSVREAFPNVLGEAMAMALPCVATDVGDAAEIVGNTGLVVEPEDPTALAKAMTHVISMAPKTRHALGRDARARVASKYSLQEVAQRYAAVYEELI